MGARLAGKGGLRAEGQGDFENGIGCINRSKSVDTSSPSFLLAYLRVLTRTHAEGAQREKGREKRRGKHC
eukprot:807412-Pleurochrysis_carterae.AAC.2